jgi:hypothetical protein
VGNGLIGLAPLMALEEAQALLWASMGSHTPHLLQRDLQVGCAKPDDLATPAYARGRLLMSKYGYYLMSIYTKLPGK